MNDSNASTDQDVLRRLAEVESLLTFLQRTAEDLSAVILEQERRIETQQKELARLAAMFGTLADAIVEAPRRPEDEKPPHY